MSTSALEQQFQVFSSRKLAGLSARAIQAVLELAGEGATVPFMARYRKERTGNLDEVQIRAVLDANEEWQELVKRKEFVIQEVAKQGNLSEELRRQIETSLELAEVEELYRPFKKKKKTKATLAREAGLGPLADWLWSLGHGELKDDTDPAVKAKDFMNPAKGYATYEEVLRGAQHIIVEKIAANPELRQQVREEYFLRGKVTATKGPKFKAHSKFETYAEYSEPVKNLEQAKASHRYLAVRRGWQEDELKVALQADDAGLLKSFKAFATKLTSDSPVKTLLDEAAEHALMVHVVPSITNELHARLKDLADQHAIMVFAENVRRVLMASPFGPKVVLGVDPGLRTGCKIVLVDKSGHYISHTVIQVEGAEAKDKAKSLFADVLSKMKIDAIAVGNGTGGREAEKFFRDLMKELGHEVPVIMVSESGASVYSASDVAREEFPDLDVTVRGAISIARRLQDPLAELVKIEPKSIGVGQYQHDVSQPKLKKSLHDVVESCVNQVGVDVNTASSSLLQYVSGIGPAIAKNLVEFRKTNGLFKERGELSKVPQLGTKAFEQAAGFLRIPESKTILDRTGIHPERYPAVREMAQELGVSVSQLLGEGAKQLVSLREKWAKLIGEYTFDDIIRELEKPGRDPRDIFKVFQYREDIHELKDLKPNLICPGIVTNVTNFGAFVDIGVHQDGLVHISELAEKFVDDPRKVVNPGDQVQVRVLAVDLEKSQISLSMRLEDRPREVRPPREARPPQSKGQAPRGERGPKREGDRPRREGERPRGDGDRPRRADERPRGADARGRPQGGERPRDSQRPRDGQKPRPQGKPFNNPFAALGQIKGGGQGN